MTTARKVLVACLIVGIIAAGYIGVFNYQAQQNYNNVTLALDYADVREWAATTGGDEVELLEAAKSHGINTVILNELELRVDEETRGIIGFFGSDPQVNAYTGLEVLTLSNLAPTANIWQTAVTDDLIERNRIYVHSIDNVRGESIFESAVTKYGKVRVQEVPVAQGYAFSITHSVTHPINGLGFDPYQITYLTDLGFDIVPNIYNASYKAAEREQLTSYIESVKQDIDPTVIIFATKYGVLGYPFGDNSAANLISETAQHLDTPPIRDWKNPYFGYVEMNQIPGKNILGEQVGFSVVRTHQIYKEEWNKRFNKGRITAANINEVVQRYLLAANDRSIRLMNLRPYTQSVAVNEQFFTALENEFKQAGYQLVPQDTASAIEGPYFDNHVSEVPGRDSLPQGVLLGLILGFSAAAVLFIDLFISLAANWKYAFLALGVATLSGIVYFAPHMTLAVQQLIALGSAIVFPVLAIFTMAERKPLESEIAETLVFVLGAIAIALIGASYVHGALGIRRFLTALQVFPMVKVALLLPVILVAFLYFWRQENAYQSLLSLLKLDLKLYHLAVLGLLGLGGVYMLVRSGNIPIAFLSQWEVKLRIFLQDTLIARPRFKEFVIGYPLLILAGYLRAKGKLWGQWVLLAGATVGLTTLINTFAHIHKPIWMALLTTLNGLWAGALIGLVLIVVWVLAERAVSSLQGME